MPRECCCLRSAGREGAVVVKVSERERGVERKRKCVVRACVRACVCACMFLMVVGSGGWQWVVGERVFSTPVGLMHFLVWHLGVAMVAAV